jgi:hypothetical protein
MDINLVSDFIEFCAQGGIPDQEMLGTVCMTMDFLAEETKAVAKLSNPAAAISSPAPSAARSPNEAKPQTSSGGPPTTAPPPMPIDDSPSILTRSSIDQGLILNLGITALTVAGAVTIGYWQMKAAAHSDTTTIALAEIDRARTRDLASQQARAAKFNMLGGLAATAGSAGMTFMTTRTANIQASISQAMMAAEQRHVRELEMSRQRHALDLMAGENEVAEAAARREARTRWNESLNWGTQVATQLAAGYLAEEVQGRAAARQLELEGRSTWNELLLTGGKVAFGLLLGS